AAGGVRRGGDADRAVNAGVAAGEWYCGLARDPGPLVCFGIELPQVIEGARVSSAIEALAAEKPQVAVGACPARAILPPARDVGRGRRSAGSIDARAAPSAGGETDERAAAAHPRPEGGGWIPHPQIVVGADVAVRVAAIAAEEPEAAVRAGPGDGAEAAAGDVAGRGRAELPVDTRFGAHAGICRTGRQ